MVTLCSLFLAHVKVFAETALSTGLDEDSNLEIALSDLYPSTFGWQDMHNETVQQPVFSYGHNMEFEERTNNIVRQI